MSRSPRSKSNGATRLGAPTFDFPFTALAAGGDSTVQAWADIGKTVIASTAKVQEETWRFVTHRLEQGVEHHKRLMACQSPSEVWEAFNGYAHQALSDYAGDTWAINAPLPVADAPAPLTEPAVAAE